MKISVGKLRELIREAMITNLSDGMKVIIENEGRSITINLVETGKPKAHGPGFITLQKKQVHDGTIWEVVNSGARRGYGPLLYDLAMEYVAGRLGDLGITPDTTTVSSEAQGVWRFYLEKRSDVEHESLPPEICIHAPARPEPLRYYYYKFETPTLDDLETKSLVTYVV